jgi:hypothetical protein
MPKILIAKKGTSDDSGQRQLVEVEDTPELQKLLDSEQCSFERYTPPETDESPTDFLATLKAETDAAEAAPGPSQRLEEQHGGDAEIAHITRALAGVFNQVEDRLPKAIVQHMDAFLKRQRPNVIEGTDHLAYMAQQAQTQHRAEYAAMGQPTPKRLLGFGESGWRSEQASEYYRAILAAGLNSAKSVSDFVQDPVVQALIEGTDASGGFLVPDDHKIEIVRNARERTVLWPLLRVRPTDSKTVRRPVRNTVGDVNVGSSAAAEVAAVTEVAIGWTELTWTPRKMDAYFPASAELLEDAGADVEAEVTDAVSDEFAEQREKLPVDGGGSGSSEPQGILGTAGIGETAIGAAVTVTAILSALYDMDDRYRRENSNLTLILRGEAYKDYAVDLALNYRNPDLLKLPVAIESRHLPQQRGIIGDMTYYWVFHNPLMRLVTEMVARNLRLDMVFWERWDGQVVRTAAFRKLNTITYT